WTRNRGEPGTPHRACSGRSPFAPVGLGGHVLAHQLVPGLFPVVVPLGCVVGAEVAHPAGEIVHGFTPNSARGVAGTTATEPVSNSRRAFMSSRGYASTRSVPGRDSSHSR